MNETVYIISASSQIERYNRLCAIIEKMELSLLSTEIDSATEYFILDDGQSRITRAFRDPREITKAIERFDKMRVRLLNRLNGGGAMLLRDVQKLNR